MTNVATILSNHGHSQEQAVDPPVHFIHHGCPKPVPASLIAWQKLKGTTPLQTQDLSSSSDMQM